MLARLAVAFLICPERLVCANREKQQQAAFLGEKLFDFPENGNHVVVLSGKTYKGLKCCLHLPCTDWVLANSGLQAPQFSAKVVSDSTLIGFRAEVCQQLRVRGYDVKNSMCQSGAEEHQVAVNIACAGITDLTIAVPNANGLAKNKGISSTLVVS